MDLKGRPTNTPQGALARLWRNIIKDNQLEPALGYLVTRYIAKHSGDSKNLKRKTRSTIEADISSNEMTWKKFTHLIFHYLCVLRLDVTIKLTYANGSNTVHTIGLMSSENDTNHDVELAKKETSGVKPASK